MNPGPVKIFTNSDVPRLRYIAGILLTDILGLHWEIVTDKRKLGKNPVINYSCEDIKGSFKIVPEEILFETGIREWNLSVSTWSGLPVFFQTREAADLPFDIFAASFYLVTRYEEYNDHETDIHGRFPATASFAFRNGFLQKPVIDLWAREWAKAMILRFNTLVFKRTEFSSLVTFDIDQPFEFLGKDIFRSIGGLFLDLGKKKGKAGERYRTYAKGEKDPWDVFDYISDTVEQEGASARFFVPVGDRSEYDRQPSWQNEDYRELVMRLKHKYSIGLHPSYHASGDTARITTEAGRLKEIISYDIHSSRYHYVRLKFPDSYSVLAEAGFTEDYSMGFADEPGFRAGIARPYFYYDLTRDEVTGLSVIPFQFMDATLHQYNNMSSDTALEVISKLMGEVRNAGGLFVSIWHNTTLLDNDEWKDWRRVFEQMLKMQKQ